MRCSQRGIHFEALHLRHEKESESAHRQTRPSGIGLASAVAVLFAFYINYHSALIYAGLGGSATAAVWNFIVRQKVASCCRPVELQSAITCSHCAHQRTEVMPTDACVYFYECESCHTTLRPKSGDCCVFCSYGWVKCPPTQLGVSCCTT